MNRVSHEIDFQILGNDMQVVEIELDPNETVIAEAGVMCWMDDKISFEAKLGDGSEVKSSFWGTTLGIGKRMLTGESIFMTHFTNVGTGKRKVSFSAPYPGTILPIDLGTSGGKIICQKDSFLCAAKGTKVGMEFSKKIGAGFFGGEGFILQKLEGDGVVFVHAGGTVVAKELKNQKILVDTGCIVAFEPSITYDIQRAGNLKSMIFGGEGLFLATLEGTGTVFLQSLPFSKLADRIFENANHNISGGKRSGNDSILTSIFDNR